MPNFKNQFIYLNSPLHSPLKGIPQHSAVTYCYSPPLHHLASPNLVFPSAESSDQPIVNTAENNRYC